MRTRRSAARRRQLAPAVAAALAALVLASAWVLRLSGGLDGRSQAAQVAVTGGETELSLDDDTGGVPLLDDVVLDPGDEVARCVSVEARTLADPEPLVLHLEAARSPLAEHLDVAITGGPDEGVDDCRDATPLQRTAGTLDSLLTDLAPSGPGWSLADPPAGVTGWWYRVEVELPADLPRDLIGASVDDLTLRWSTAAAERRETALRARADAFVVGVTEDATVPLVLLAVVALLFLGIHDRIDANDPKLALAPVDRRVRRFTDRDLVGRGPNAAHDGPAVPPPDPGGPGTV